MTAARMAREALEGKREWFDAAREVVSSAECRELALGAEDFKAAEEGLRAAVLSGAGAALSLLLSEADDQRGSAVCGECGGAMRRRSRRLVALPAVIHRVNELGADAYLSVITIGELFRGTQLLEPGRRQRALIQSLRRTEQLRTTDPPHARVWGQITAETRGVGREVPPLDGLIAATALHHGMAVLTAQRQPLRADGSRGRGSLADVARPRRPRTRALPAGRAPVAPHRQPNPAQRRLRRRPLPAQVAHPAAAVFAPRRVRRPAVRTVLLRPPLQPQPTRLQHRPPKHAVQTRRQRPRRLRQRRRQLLRLNRHQLHQRRPLFQRRRFRGCTPF